MLRNSVVLPAGVTLPGPLPVHARHAEWSTISSADDLYVRPTNESVELLLDAAGRALEVDLDHVAERCATPQEAAWVRLWPGEHYRLLPALVNAFAARHVVEIGTFQGPSTLALLSAIPKDGSLITYDLVPWRDIFGAILREEDFGPSLEQRLGDLSDPGFLTTQIDTIRGADLIFLDGPKDGVFEQAFCAEVLPQLVDRRRLVVLDDIRLLTMVQLWCDLPYKKLDATSLGHWSGTGIMFTA